MRLNYDRLSEELLAAGMQKVRANELTKQIRQDMLDWPDVYADWELCKWALERNFVPGRVRLFGSDFNEETYKNYYADFDYFMAHPLNNHFAIWINDKLTLKYVLNVPKLSGYMPEYYLYIENDGQYTYLMDAPHDIPKDSDFLYNLLLKKEHLALKPNRGAGGAGFLGLHYVDGKIYKNSKPITRVELDALMPLLNGYIVTEFIEQSKQMDEVYSKTACALRIVLYKKVKEHKEAKAEYDCLLAYARFGTDKNDAVSNNDQGGLAIQIDWENGLYKGNFRGLAKFWGEDAVKGFVRHPNTGVQLDGQRIPNWDIVKSGLLDICEYLSSLDFFGMDVIVTETGFKICEINSAPSTGRGQYLYGESCLNNEDARRFVRSKQRPSKKSFLECFQAAVEEF